MIHGARSKKKECHKNIGNYEGLSIFTANHNEYEPIFRAYRVNPLGGLTPYKVAKYTCYQTRGIERTTLNGVRYSKSDMNSEYTAVCVDSNPLHMRYYYDEDLNFERWRLLDTSIPFENKRGIFGNIASTKTLEAGNTHLTDEEKFELNLMYGTIAHINVEPEKDLIYDIFPYYLPTKEEFKDMTNFFTKYNIGLIA